MDLLHLLNDSPRSGIAFLFSIVIAITVHEFAHAYTAYRLGDDTPFLQGRVTLNPLAHLDPVGSILFLLFGFGWGKPVIYNPMRLSRRSDELLIALAGPISNILLAITFNLLAVVLSRSGVPSDLVTIAANVNILLASFNMLPIPPLDGSSIVAYFWPPYRSLLGSQIGLVLLIIFILPIGSGNLLSLVLSPIQFAFTFASHLFGVI